MNIKEIKSHIHSLKDYAIQELEKIENIEIYNKEVNGSTIAFNLIDYPVHDALAMYSNEGICIRGGHMCNQLTINLLKQNAVLRASLNIYNDENDIDELVKATKKILEGDQLAWMDI